MIKQLNVYDCKESARIHMESMPNDFLPGFGIDFLVILHKHFIYSSRSISLGYFQRNNLQGVIICSIKTKELYYEVFQKSIKDFIPLILRKFIKTPHILKYLLQTLSYGFNSKDNITSELLVVAVDKDHRNKGIGSKLLTRIKHELKKRKITAFKVGTLSTNKIANAFYRKMKGKYIRNISIYNRTWNIYEFNCD